MKKLIYISIFCFGMFVTSLLNYIFPIKSASAESPGKQDLLYTLAYNLAEKCDAKVLGINWSWGAPCLDFHTYYKNLGGTNELIFYAREQYNKDRQSK